MSSDPQFGRIVSLSPTLVHNSVLVLKRMQIVRVNLEQEEDVLSRSVPSTSVDFRGRSGVRMIGVGDPFWYFLKRLPLMSVGGAYF